MKRNTLLIKLLAAFSGLLTAVSLQAQDGSVYTPSAYGSSSNVGGSVRSWTARKPETNPNNITTSSNIQDFQLTTQYVDGMGRPVQTVVKQGSQPTGGTTHDLVSAKVYDIYGREFRMYLPFADTAASGNFQVNPFQQQSSFYSGSSSPVYGQGENYYYGKTEYETSPFARAQKSFAPGDSWVHGGKGMEMHYWNNTTADSVRIWSVTDSSGKFGSYSTTRLYTVGTLYKTIMIDERGKQVVIFADKQGDTILTKRQLTAQADTGQGSGHYGWLCTYYIYDGAARMRAVVQPVGVEQLLQHNWDLTWNSSVLLNEQCFRYEYDELNRVIMKKVPGAAMEEMVYDARNRLVLTRDGKLRVGSHWMVIRYDSLNRPYQTWLLPGSTSRATYQSSASSSTDYPGSSALSGDTLLTEIYYDNYSWVGSTFSATRSTVHDSYLAATDNSTYPYPQSPVQSSGSRVTGMVTGGRNNIIGTTSYLYTINYYDDKGRVIQTQRTNYSGGRDTATVEYTWAGQRYITAASQQKSGTNSQVTVAVTRGTYDALSRITKIEKRISNSKVSGGMSAWKTVSQIEYDALGQVKKNKLGSAPLDSLVYEYNIRGWLLGMNRGFVKDTTSTTTRFGFDLGYNKASFTVNSSAQHYNDSLYNGNVAGMLWRSCGDGYLRKYDFTYDPVNRLTGADFNQLNNNSFSKAAGVDYSMSELNYDGNGNILTMNQKGWKVGGSVTIDSLLYTYNGSSNRLLNVWDRNNDTATTLGDFRSSKAYMTILGTKTTSTTDYAYDSSGNLTLDNNKDISSISYNYLNLPQIIKVKGKGTINYTYDAGGNKLQKITVDSTVSPVKTTTTLYMAGVFVNDTLQFLPQEEGRIRFNVSDASLQYDYFIKDHLGNVRMVLTEQHQVDTYPAATLETSNLSNERLYYSKVDSGRVNKSTVSGYPTDTYTSPNDYIQKLNGNGVKVGMGKVLKVMAGDTVNIRVSSWWNSVSLPNTPVDPLTDLIAAMSSGIGGISTKAGVGALSGSSAFSSNIGSFLSRSSGYSGSVPKAFVNWILFDEQMNYVAGSSGFDQVGASNTFKTHTLNGKRMNKNGYLYIYVSNETPNIDVFFDNLQVTQVHGPVLEESHYYPFGLQMAGISSKALNFGQQNRYKFNGGTELNEDLGVELYETTFRGYDPQIGRFAQIDPLAIKYAEISPYVYALNNPYLYNDPSGLASAPDYVDIHNAQDLIDYINQYGIGGLPDGYTKFIFGDDGNLNGFMYGEDPSLGYNKNGVYGLTINFSGWIADGDDKDLTHQTINSTVVGVKFIAANTLYSDWNQWNSDQTGENVKNAIGLGADIQAAVFSGAKVLLKESSHIMKPFSGPMTAVGAIAGGGTAIYDMITNPNANYWKDGAQLGLAAIAVIAEFVGAGEIWDAVGVVAGTASTAIDIYDMSQHK